LGGRAEVYGQAGEYDHALADATEAIRLKPNDQDGYVKRGWAHISKKDYDSAITDFTTAIRLNPDAAFAAYRGRATAHQNKGDFDRAIADLGNALRLAPDSSGAYLARASAYSDKGEYDQAIADNNEAVRLKPDQNEAYNNRGVTYSWQHQYEPAIKDFDEAIRLDPQNAFARANRARSLLGQGKLDEAEAEVERALKLGRDRAALLEIRGTVESARNKESEAIDDFSEAVHLGQSDPRTYAGRGAAYEKQGRLALAIEDYRKATELSALSPPQREARIVARERLAALEAQKPTATPNANQPEGQPIALGRRIALVIGISAYQTVQRLPNPVNDAQGVAEALRHLGFAEVIELHDLTRASMEKALKDFGDRAASADWAVVFYAGHGMQVDGNNFLIPADAEIASVNHVDDETINLDRVLRKAAVAKKLGLVILDSCRNNPFLDRMIQGGRAPRGIGSGLASVEPSHGELVVFATRDGHVASDGEGEHSPFTQALLYHIDEPSVDVELLFRKVRDTVMATTKNAQEPFTYGSLPGEQLFLKIAATH
jgi:tetratricopeptide (TPR) repeat protein